MKKRTQFVIVFFLSLMFYIGGYNLKVLAADTKSDNSTNVLYCVENFEIGGTAYNALRLNWSENAHAQGYIIEKNDNGQWNRIARIEGSQNKTFRVEGLKPSTEYEFRIKAFSFNNYGPIYSDYIYTAGKTKPEAITGFQISGNAYNALRVNWNVNNTAQGYIVEQKNNNNWKRVARIEGKQNKTYRIEGLMPCTEYVFRIQAFNFYNDTPIYSDYVYTSGVTKPNSLNGVQIGGTAYNALRINWNADSTSQGYIIEQKVNNEWKRIARIGNLKTNTYRVEGLNPSKEYFFRIQAFSFFNDSPIYGDYAYLSGKTKPISVTDFNVAGSADNALRVNWSSNNAVQGYIIEKKQDNNWQRIARIEGKDNKTYRAEGLKAFTEYSFRMQAFDFYNNCPLYSDYVYTSGITKPSMPNNFRIAGMAYNALRVNWDVNNTAQGYIIEKKVNGNWQRIARIDGKQNYTYRVEGLNSSTEYQFRMQTFNFYKNTPVYSDYVYISGKTKPTEVENLKIGGQAYNALRLNWNKNDTAQGYIIEQKINGSWQRIARIADKDVLTYRVKNLKPLTTYEFRIQGFNFYNNMPLYSDYSNVSGKTLNFDVLQEDWELPII